ncbi:MAG TPA: sulfotransferase domain-containing protein [Acidimicrobiales bacterium]
MLPNFLLIGAMKAGTDSLWEYLRAHPQVFMSVPKEIDFFVKELNWPRGIEWYESHFARTGAAQVIGEASTSYSKWPVHQGVPERIASVVPDVRIVYLVRHPIDRIHSQYLHQRLLGLERRSLSGAVLSDPSYLNFSRYGLQLRQYLDYFDRSQILVLKSEDLRHDRRATAECMANFLHIDNSWPHEVLNQEFHSTSEKRVLRHGFTIAQKIPGHDAIARRVPDRIKDKTLPLRTRGVNPSHFVMTDDICQRLAERLAEDALELRELLGASFEYWDIT